MRFCSIEGCKNANFGQDKITKKPYCRNHQTKRTDLDRRTIIQRAMDKQSALTSKVRKLERTDPNLESVVKSIVKGELQEWFNYHMENSQKKCENCGASLGHYNRLDWYGSQHHIIEKHLCPSVATELLNHMVLGKWCCHSQWHTNYMNAQKMGCFPLALARFVLFKDNIARDEVKNIPDCFLLPNSKVEQVAEK